MVYRLGNFYRNVVIHGREYLFWLFCFSKKKEKKRKKRISQSGLKPNSDNDNKLLMKLNYSNGSIIASILEKLLVWNLRLRVTIKIVLSCVNLFHKTVTTNPDGQSLVLFASPAIKVI